MGVETVKRIAKDSKQMQEFVASLLSDVRALEYMIENNWFETGIKRIGAEQEMCLMDSHYRPSLTNMAIMDEFSPDWLTTELGKFNLECNLSPREFVGTSLGDMEAELTDYLSQIKTVAARHKANILLTGIMPTLKKSDMTLDNLTPKPRYKALMAALRDMRGADYEVRLDGIDELIIKHDSPLLEACNTSFQVHLQVQPDNFVQMYNIALALAGPTLAAAANSPLLFGKRLWHETRIALFQQSVDTRTSIDHVRDRSPRVTFGNNWLKKSILEIYKEDIMRFRVVLGGDVEEDAFERLKAGVTPKLKSLQVHNSTVYRWNRPCYGISPNGKPHLRIENRILPSGPTIADEMANTAFWLGLMEGMATQYGDITKQISFDDVRDNFIKGARTGIDSKFTWLNNKKITAKDLVTEELVHIARQGLEQQNIAKNDIDRYLDIIKERAERHATGARWMLRSYSQFMQETTRDEAITALSAAMYKNQESGKPIHEWELPKLEELDHYEPTKLQVEEFMSTDLFTVHKEDILDLVADMMDWHKIRYTPVEDEDGKLVGLVTARLLLRHFYRKDQINTKEKGKAKEKTVADIMITEMVTIRPDQTVLEAINLLNSKDIGCLPVVKDGKLVGMVTEKDFLNMSKRLIQRTADR